MSEINTPLSLAVANEAICPERSVDVACRTKFAEFAMALGGFAIGTGEIVIMGLLPEVAAHTGVSIPYAGHAITAYALGVVIGAPLIATFAARWPRHWVLIALMAWYALGNIASALAPGYAWLIAFRFASGLPHGAYFGVASLVAASLVPPDQRGRAVGRLILGLTLAIVTGVPAATWIGQTFGWQAAFVTVGLTAAASAVLITLFVPRRPGDPAASPLRELSALRRPQVLLTLGIGSVGFGGFFCVFSYISPTMTQVAGMPERWMPIVLAIFGCGMIVGNTIGSRFADRALMATIGGTLLWNIVIIGLFTFSAHHITTALLNAFLIGCGMALVPALQIRLMDVAHNAQTLAASLNHSAFNIANALGAWLGGMTITAGYGWTSTGWVGSLLAVAGMLIFLVALTQSRSADRTAAGAS